MLYIHTCKTDWRYHILYVLTLLEWSLSALFSIFIFVLQCLDNFIIDVMSCLINVNWLEKNHVIFCCITICILCSCIMIKQKLYLLEVFFSGRSRKTESQIYIFNYHLCTAVKYIMKIGFLQSAGRQVLMNLSLANEQ